MPKDGEPANEHRFGVSRILIRGTMRCATTMPRRLRKYPPSSAQLELGFSQPPREIERVFLGWSKPLLPLTVEYLFREAGDDLLDLRHLIVAAPVARAGGRLLEALVAKAETLGVAVLPPRVVTTGALADVLVPPLHPSAHPCVRALLWGECLRNAPTTMREAVVPSPPSPNDWLGWLRLGTELDRLDAELAAGFISFDEVLARASDLEEFRGPERWRALADLRAILATRLDQLQLDDPSARRRAAVQSRQVSLLPSTTRVLLLGAADLNVVTRRMLDLIRTSVTALIHAPSSHAHRFDRFGCVRPSEWQSGPEGDLALQVVDGPEHQAASVVATLAEQTSGYCLQDVVVGVPDPDVVAPLEETLEQLDVPTRNAAGRPMRRTPPLQMLAAVARYLQEGTVQSLAALARHPDVAARVDVQDEPSDWRTLLDQYQSEHVAHELGNQFLGDPKAAESLALRKDALDSLLGELCGPERVLSRWAEPLALLFVSVYGHELLNPEDARDRVTLAVSAAARNVLRAIHALPEDAVGMVPASVAARILFDAIADEAIPDPPDREAIELLGWLELPFDDTPVLVLTGINEGFVPKSLNADPFLPDALRRHLGLVDNRMRFGRDAFFVSAMLQSRASVTLISGRRSSTSDPLAPSRLTLCGDAPAVARRVLDFYGDKTGGLTTVAGRIRPGVESDAFPIPFPQPLRAPMDSLGVTAFKDYLSCPYRFYLKHVLKLRTLRDDAVELDGRLFGNLAHDVLRDFGRSSVASSTDWREVLSFLNERLDCYAEKSFSDCAYPSVRVQVEQLRGRLSKFARWQAGWAMSGKRILFVEHGFEGEDLMLDVDGAPFRIYGRIDRLDRDETTGTLYVFDYKVPNALRKPESDHVVKGQWRNLQLPLYRLMVSAVYPSQAIELGYICLSADSAGVRESLAGWSQQELDSAEQVIKDVIRNLRDEVFWPPTQPPPRFSEELAAICQDARLGGGVWADLEGEDEE